MGLDVLRGAAGAGLCATPHRTDATHDCEALPTLSLVRARAMQYHVSLRGSFWGHSANLVCSVSLVRRAQGTDDTPMLSAVLPPASITTFVVAPCSA